MKNGLFFLFLISGTIVFGQSAKKLNEQLRSVLVAEQQKQDSVALIFIQSGKQQERLKLLSSAETKKLEGKLETLRKTQRLVRELFKALNYLGEHPDTSGVSGNLNLSDNPDLTRSAKELVKQFETAQHTPDSLSLEGLKRKRQNELLKAKIAEYRTVMQENTLRLQRNEARGKQLEGLMTQMDSLSLVYRNANKALLPKQKELVSQLKLLRENYRLKGPKGFPEAYKMAFPDIHPGSRDPRNEFEPQPQPVEVFLPPFYTSYSMEDEIYSLVDEPAEFPGGRAAMMQYLAKNIKYPESAWEEGIGGKVYLKFVVSDRGEISNVTVQKGIPDCRECNEEAVRVIKGMPRWIPAKKDGEQVSSYSSFPITFRAD